jgi:hypothetical protein
MTASEAQLVDRAVKGDPEALTELLERDGPIVRQRIEPKIGSVWRTVLDAGRTLQAAGRGSVPRLADADR